MARSKFRAGDRDRAKAMFRALPRSVRKATSTALDGAAEELAEAIRRRAPVAQVDGGELRDSVRWRRGKPAKSEGGVQTQAAGADADITVRVIAGNQKAWYPHIVEFGSAPGIRAVKAKPGRAAYTMDHPGNPAQPFFFPTFRSLRKRLAGKIKRRQRKAIREAAGE